MEFAKYDIRSCIKTTQMPTHIFIVLHIMAQQNPKTFNCVDVLERNAIKGGVIFFGVRIRLGAILGRFSIIYVRGIGLRIRVRVRVRVRVWVRVSVMVRVSVVLSSG